MTLSPENSVCLLDSGRGAVIQALLLLHNAHFHPEVYTSLALTMRVSPAWVLQSLLYNNRI